MCTYKIYIQICDKDILYQQLSSDVNFDIILAFGFILNSDNDYNVFNKKGLEYAKEVVDGITIEAIPKNIIKDYQYFISNKIGDESSIRHWDLFNR